MESVASPVRVGNVYRYDGARNIMKKNGEKLVIVGDGETAQLAYEYFIVDSPYEVVAFSVEQTFLKQTEQEGLPVVPFEGVENVYDPTDFRIFVAVSSTKLNRPRARLYRACKEKGYKPVSYISSKAFVWRTAEIGENCFILENNVIQHKVKIGNDVTLWSGNHIGHRTVIGDHCFISSHCVISGFCEIGESSFIGVNSTFADNIKVGRDCLIGAGALITTSTKPGTIYPGANTKPSSIGSLQFFGITE